MNYIFILIGYVLLINLIAFLTMLYDKKQAEKHDYRISEKALFILALLLGGIGIYAGIYVFRHKTRHKKFTIGIPIVILINIISLYYIVSYMINNQLI
ncbi:MAG: DUF1294 domain-containing protein [Clostridia bacterium]|nr:DUF1294 domain-containing protein [Clostridia bacterium]